MFLEEAGGSTVDFLPFTFLFRTSQHLIVGISYISNQSVKAIDLLFFFIGHPISLLPLPFHAALSLH
ncbi:hypothetical protein OIU79_019692 [Salix purpurea]|uniref:Uncharacterized protein n=1 Tax=Salix purpurea TaxID=77065 RepID=A0A9Q0SJT8_SALPP|nr:hypothetical protein OIU79_019692 [Salix purpurea]